jgi:hypothetical protein
VLRLGTSYKDVMLKRISRQENSAPKILCKSKSKVPSCVNTNFFLNTELMPIIEQTRRIDKKVDENVCSKAEIAIYNPSFCEVEINEMLPVNR